VEDEMKNGNDLQLKSIGNFIDKCWDEKRMEAGWKLDQNRSDNEG
jgi:hypothetical protein